MGILVLKTCKKHMKLKTFMIDSTVGTHNNINNAINLFYSKQYIIVKHYHIEFNLI